MIFLYPIRCILPYDRYVRISENTVQAYAITSSSTFHDIVVIDKEQKVHLITLEELGNMFHFTYIAHLEVLHEKDLRDLLHSAISSTECPRPSLSNKFNEQLQNGTILDSLFIKYVGEDVGYGLFTSNDQPAGTFVGEYVGILGSYSGNSNTGNISAYTLIYPSMDGEYDINAGENGNVVRFINHSYSPNAEFLCAWNESSGIHHVVCVLKQHVFQNEQITVDYGHGYWKFRLPIESV